MCLLPCVCMCTRMSTCVLHACESPQSREKGHQIPRTGVTSIVSGCCELNSGPLLKQQVLLLKHLCSPLLKGDNFNYTL